MNREVKVKKVKGRGRVYYNPCPIRNQGHEQIMVGTVACQQCQRFKKIFNKDGKQLVHCENHV